MENIAPQYWLITLICSQLALAGCVIAYLRWGSRSTRATKQPPSPPTTENFEIRFAALAADQAELFSTLEKLTTTTKRLSSRQGMRDVRERQAQDDPPEGTSKAELLRHYGMTGKVGPDFARAQLDLERTLRKKSN